MNAPYQSQKIQIQLEDITVVHIYRYMFQYRSLRIVTKNAEEYIFEFQKPKYAQKVLEVLLGTFDYKTSNKDDASVAVSERSQEPLCKDVSDHLFTNVQYYQDAWQRGMLSNGDYLLYLNFIAHRSFNDPT